MIRRIVSGGQTGVDRAALDAAVARDLEIGGWCPRGRLAEDGEIPSRYPLTETDSRDYAVRTEANVRDSDATLVVCRGRITGGTAFTLECARRLGRPSHVWTLGWPGAIEGTCAWLRSIAPDVLNVAGPRESGEPGIHEEAVVALARLFGECRAG